MLFKHVRDYFNFGTDDAGDSGADFDDQVDETTDAPTATLEEESSDQDVDSTQEDADQDSTDLSADDSEGEASASPEPTVTDSDELDTSTNSDSDSIELDTQESSSDDMTADDSGQATESSDEEPTLSPAPTRPYRVESWRPLVTEMAGDIPVEVLLRWIKHESGGNPCSTGKIVNGASIENGLFQLYSPDDDHLATPAQLHGSFCSGQACTRDLSLEEARIQVASGIAYVRICRERARVQLKQAGVEWDEAGSDFWSLVKMQHNLPSVAKLVTQLHSASWSEYKEGVLKQQPKYGQTTIFSNAEDIGAAAGMASQ